MIAEARRFPLTTRSSGLADHAEYILDVMAWYKAHADLAH
jgi:hypothetical protein